MVNRKETVGAKDRKDQEKDAPDDSGILHHNSTFNWTIAIFLFHDVYNLNPEEVVPR